MIPAPVRSVPQTDRWCLQLLTSMQRDCDTDNPLVGEAVDPRGCRERPGRVWGLGVLAGPAGRPALGRFEPRDDVRPDDQRSPGIRRLCSDLT